MITQVTGEQSKSSLHHAHQMLVCQMHVASTPRNLQAEYDVVCFVRFVLHWLFVSAALLMVTR